MKALFLKDFYTAMAKVKFFLIIILAFSFMGGISFEGISASGFALYFSLLIPQTLIAYDEQSNFSKYSKILPFSDFEIVFSKYLLGYLLLILISTISTISITLFNLNNFDMIINQVSPLIILSLISLCFFAIYLPGLIIFGTQKGRFITLILIFCFFFLATQFNTISPDLLLKLYTNIPLLIITAIIFNIVSVFIAVTFYKKKKYLPS